jgi:hypothetical protein
VSFLPFFLPSLWLFRKNSSLLLLLLLLLTLLQALLMLLLLSLLLLLLLLEQPPLTLSKLPLIPSMRGSPPNREKTEVGCLNNCQHAPFALSKAFMHNNIDMREHNECIHI